MTQDVLRLQVPNSIPCAESFSPCERVHIVSGDEDGDNVGGPYYYSVNHLYLSRLQR